MTEQAKTHTHWRVCADIKDCGWDIETICVDPYAEGPFVQARILDKCPCCGHEAVLFTVVNLATGVGIERTWCDDGMNAQEEAAYLNGIWAEGCRAALRGAG